LEVATKVRGPVVRPLGDALGAEIVGLDLSEAVGDGTIEQVRRALQDYLVVCIRDQSLSESQQIAFSKRLGPLEVFPEKDKTKSASTIYNVANVAPDGEHLAITDQRVIFQKVNARWHTDSSYRYVPAFASLLYAIEVMPEDAPGGETEFSNMFAAWDGLAPAMQQRLLPLHMVHTYEFGRRLFPELPPLSPAEREFVPPVSHPLVRVHPDRGNRRSLYMTMNAGNEVSGMPLEDGQALHRRLGEHLSQARFCYLHKWREGDLVIWDNRATLHRAREYDMAKYRRVLRRTTVAGAGPVLGPYSQPDR
jgi:alpha-ketoglutarate-dependent taurine dioxygenase